MALLKTSRKFGNENMSQIVENACAKLGIDVSVARLYYDSLVYHLSEREIQGIELFYKSLYQAGITEVAAPLFFFENMTQNTASQAPLSYTESPARSISLETAGCCPAI
jgi:hypothetical protein